jgi:hypothetical protein
MVVQKFNNTATSFLKLQYRIDLNVAAIKILAWQLPMFRYDAGDIMVEFMHLILINSENSTEIDLPS